MAAFAGFSPGPDGGEGIVPLFWIIGAESGHIYGPGDWGRKFFVIDADHPDPGLPRYYEIHVPPSYSAATPMPVVVVLHGGGGYGAGVRWSSDMDSVSDDEGFIVIYPGATNPDFPLVWGQGLFWHTGREQTDPLWLADDITFLRTHVLTNLALYFNIDTERIYACGFSNGANMLYRVAAEMADVFSACSAISGPMAPEEFEDASGLPINILHLHGALDTIFPPEGDDDVHVPGSPFEPFVSASVDDAMQAWADQLNCTELVTTQEGALDNAAHQNAGAFRVDDDSVAHFTKRVCPDTGMEVVSILFDDNGHTWIGGRTADASVEPHSTALGNSSRVMWQFFSSHSL